MTDDFSEGLAAVCSLGKCGYINKYGKIVIKPLFDSAYSFRNGLAQVHIGSRIGYIDKTGKYIWKPS